MDTLELNRQREQHRSRVFHSRYRRAMLKAEKNERRVKQLRKIYLGI